MLAKNLIKQALNIDLPNYTQDFVVEGLTSDSRTVGQNYIFIALAGTQADGADFAKQAESKGAKLVVTHRKINNLSVPQVVVDDDISAVPAKLAGVFYGTDKLIKDGRIRIYGVTGTNGKTTSCILIQHIFWHNGKKCARFGTIEYDIIAEKISATHTTPDAIKLAELIKKTYENGADTVVMEVSSHSLVQGRCAGIKFAGALFTNLSGDHLDYHGSMEEYLRAKMLLFRSLDEQAVAVVNIDDAGGREILKLAGFKKITYAIENENARLCAKIKKVSALCNSFDVIFDNQKISVESPYIGRHNIYNLLGAIGIAISSGLELSDIALALDNLPVIPGRLERIETKRDFQVFVDYAHTDDGLKNVLSAIKPFVGNRLILVFGCGGDRDVSKRPRMAEIAERYADIIIVTNDNPRTEEPKKIIEDILAGFSEDKRKEVIVERDRAKAIKQAIEMADGGDIVLIAGKGHENYQIIGTERIDFDDREVVRRIVEC